MLKKKAKGWWWPAIGCFCAPVLLHLLHAWAHLDGAKCKDYLCTLVLRTPGGAKNDVQTPIMACLIITSWLFHQNSTAEFLCLLLGWGGAAISVQVGHVRVLVSESIGDCTSSGNSTDETRKKQKGNTQDKRWLSNEFFFFEEHMYARDIF